MRLLRKPLCPGVHDILINRTSRVLQWCKIFGGWGKRSHPPLWLPEDAELGFVFAPQCPAVPPAPGRLQLHGARADSQRAEQ